MLVQFTIFTWAGIGYFTLYFDVWMGAIVGAILGGIAAVLLWKYESRNAQVV